MSIFPTGGAGRIRVNHPQRLTDELAFTPPIGSEMVTCFATDRDVSAELPAPLVGRLYEPLPHDLAVQLPQIFAGLSNVRRADASVTFTITW